MFFLFLYCLYCCRCCCCGKKDEDTNYNDDDRADVLHRISGQERLLAVMASDFAVSRYESIFCQVPGVNILQVIARLREACIVVWLYLDQ